LDKVEVEFGLDSRATVPNRVRGLEHLRGPLLAKQGDAAKAKQVTRSNVFRIIKCSRNRNVVPSKSSRKNGKVK